MSNLRDIMEADDVFPPVADSSAFPPGASFLPNTSTENEATIADDIQDTLIADDQGMFSYLYEGNENIPTKESCSNVMGSENGYQDQADAQKNNDNETQSTRAKPTVSENINNIKQKLEISFIIHHIHSMFGNKSDAYSKQLLADFSDLFKQKLSGSDINKIMLLLKKESSVRCGPLNLVGVVISDIIKSTTLTSILGADLAQNYVRSFETFLANSSIDVFSISDITNADDEKLSEINKEIPSTWQQAAQFAASLGFGVFCKLVTQNLAEIKRAETAPDLPLEDNIYHDKLPEEEDAESIKILEENQNESIFKLPG